MNLKPQFDLRTLYYFTVLADKKHFGMAARVIGIEQPPLSLQIQKLEKIIGAKLFDRSTRQIVLTAVGEAFLPEAVGILERSQQMLDGIRNFSRGEAGILNIGFATSTTFSGVPAIIQKHKQQYPKVELRLREISSAVQITELLNGTIDVGFIREAPQVKGIRCEEIKKERFVAVLSKQNRLSKTEGIRLKQLAGEPFVHFPKHVAPGLYEKVNELFASAGMVPNIVQEALEWQTIVSLVEANIGVSICPESFQSLKIGAVRYKHLKGTTINTSIGICYTERNTSPLLAGFIKLAHQYIV